MRNTIHFYYHGESILPIDEGGACAAYMAAINNAKQRTTASAAGAAEAAEAAYSAIAVASGLDRAAIQAIEAAHCAILSFCHSRVDIDNIRRWKLLKILSHVYIDRHN